jgi:beta-phosphoglucomutase-like phosphatase (HAD superfamily)
MALKLVISDLDGTLVETEDYHRRAYNLLFQELGLDISWSKQDYMDRLTVMGGGKLREVFSWLGKPEKQFAQFKREMYEKKTQLYLQLITSDLDNGTLSLRPGVARLFAEIEKAGVPLAIGTACEKKAAFEVLDAALGPSFTGSLAILCGGDDTPYKKPNPAIYLMVAEQCGVDPMDCVVFEDTRHGMQAALSAGMKCVVTPSEYAMNHNFSEATMLVKDFENPNRLNLQDLYDLF